MENRVKELIALGASVSANCQPCLHYHVGQARASGANEQDIRDAIAVGKIVREGAAGMMDKFISTTMKENTTGSDPGDAVDGCTLT